MSLSRLVTMDDILKAIEEEEENRRYRNLPVNWQRIMTLVRLHKGRVA